MADSAVLVETLLRDFPEMRFGYTPSGSLDEDLRHLVRHMASIANELTAKEPASPGLRMCFVWSTRLAGDQTTSALAESFYRHLSSTALALQPAR